MIRSFFFKMCFYLGIIFICILYVPSFFLPYKVTLSGGKLMGYWADFCLKFFMSTKILIKGRENIIQDKKFFIACSHQSMFETFYLQVLFNSPIFILKKELLSIPVFGWYLKKIGSISINRNKVAKENLDFFENIVNSIKNSGRPVIIFPQATRVLPTDRTPFKKGAGRIYEELKIYCQPVAINSGFVWPKKGPKTLKKNITVSILKPIDPGMNKDDFNKTVEKMIYSELDLIN